MAFITYQQIYHDHAKFSISESTGPIGGSLIHFVKTYFSWILGQWLVLNLPPSNGNAE